MLSRKQWFSSVAALITVTLSPWALAQSDATDRHVVLISIDGFAGYLVDDPKVPLPNIRRLAEKGCLIEGGMTVSDPSVTWPTTRPW